MEGMELSRGAGKDATETARQEQSGGESGGEEATRRPFNILTRTGRVLTRSQEQTTRVEEIMDTVYGSQTTVGTVTTIDSFSTYPRRHPQEAARAEAGKTQMAKKASTIRTVLGTTTTLGHPRWRSPGRVWRRCAGWEDRVFV